MGHVTLDLLQVILFAGMTMLKTNELIVVWTDYRFSVSGILGI